MGADMMTSSGWTQRMDFRAPGFTPALALKSGLRTATLESDPARQHLPEHHPVADEAVERMAEGGGAILLDRQMRDPRKAVTRDQAAQKPPWIAGGDQGCDAQQRQAGAQEMQPPRRAVRMLAEVEGVELRKAGKGLHGLSFSW